MTAGECDVSALGAERRRKQHRPQQTEARTEARQTHPGPPRPGGYDPGIAEESTGAERQVKFFWRQAAGWRAKSVQWACNDGGRHTDFLLARHVERPELATARRGAWAALKIDDCRLEFDRAAHGLYFGRVIRPDDVDGHRLRRDATFFVRWDEFEGVRTDGQLVRWTEPNDLLAVDLDRGALRPVHQDAHGGQSRRGGRWRRTRSAWPDAARAFRAVRGAARRARPAAGGVICALGACPMRERVLGELRGELAAARRERHASAAATTQPRSRQHEHNPEHRGGSASTQRRKRSPRAICATWRRSSASSGRKASARLNAAAAATKSLSARAVVARFTNSATRRGS